ncbi:MFS general substrate transporter [Hypoxylon sp. FL1284]|nr:MFS general substrate transporter [Hypoxylon sp. FL1284]
MEAPRVEASVLHQAGDHDDPKSPHAGVELTQVQDPPETSPSPGLPRTWSRPKKWTATLILSAFAFLQPLSETMLAPAQGPISRDLGIAQPYEWLLANSLILIGVGLSPLVLAPLSELYGRKPVLVAASVVFVVWNAGCGAAATVGQLLAFRLLSGFGASVADAVAGGFISDLWDAEERGRAFAIYMAAPLLGPALGPICGAFIAQGTTWRWIFYVTSIASGVVILISIPLLHETFEPRTREVLREKKDGQNNASTASPRQKVANVLKHMRIHLQRPLRMLGTQAIVQLLATYMALLYGTMFLFLFMYPLMWTERYGESTGIGSLNYLSFAIGLILGVNVAGHLSDRIYRRLRDRNHGVGRPEFRVPAMVLGTLLVPVGLLWWGWSGQARLHWIMPNIGSLLFAMGVYVCSGCVSVYTIDTYTQYAASAISTNLVLRSLTAAFFPLFAPYMFDALGFGLGATVLAGVFVLFGSLVIFTLWFYGERIRTRSPYCVTETP